MMDGEGSPNRTQQHLLRDDESMQGPRMGAYRPPPAPPIESEDHDLHFTAVVDDGVDEMNPGPSSSSSSSYTTSNQHRPPPHHHNGSGDEMEYQMPPLISYCSYVRYACAFSKWLILVIIANVVAYWVCVKGRYFDYYGYWGMGDIWPFDSWKGAMIASVWFGSSVFFYLSAKVIDRDVRYVDTVAQYELGNTSDTNNDGVYNGGTSGGAAPALNFEHVYGQVSRKLDHFFRPKSAATSSRTGILPPIEGTSGLVNVSFALWVLLLGAAVYLGTGTAMGMLYVDDACDPRNLPNTTSGGKSKFGSKDYSDIGTFPPSVQDWIVDFNNEYFYSYSNDDFYSDDRPQMSLYSFPVSSLTQTGTVASMTGGDTIFFAGKPPSTKVTPDDGAATYSDAKAMVLVESNSEGYKYYRDITNPRMFIPIENTISTGADGSVLASQYCFSAAMDAAERKKNRQRSWDSVVRSTTIRCIVNAKNPSNGTKFDILKATISWKDKGYTQGLRAASSGGILLVGHLGQGDLYMYEEVVSIDPSKDMEKNSVFHLTKTNDEYWNNWGDESGGNRSGSSCVQSKVRPYATIAAMVVMVLGGLWLILREGVAAGVVPFMFCGVATIRIVTGEYSSGINILCMTAGAMFFHFVLCCEGIMGHICHLPNWIGRDMYIWSLYSWISSFYLMNYLFRMYEIDFGSITLLILSGIILDHPVGHVLGFLSIAQGFIIIVMWPFFGQYGGFGRTGTVSIVFGFGLIGVSKFFSDNRRFCGAVCRPCSRAGRAMVYGSPTITGPAPGGPTSAAAVPTSNV